MTLARLIVAVLLSYVLALQGVALAASSAPTLDPFGIVCSHSNAPSNNHSTPHQHPCCTPSGCAVHHVFGPTADAAAPTRTAATTIRTRLAPSDAPLLSAATAVVRARGPPRPV